MANQSTLHVQGIISTVFGLVARLAHKACCHLAIIFFAVTSAYTVSQIVLAAYRLSSHHPLARFPGPRLARATRWYRTYHEVFRGGKMFEELSRLHNIYGPVVRFGPNDLHFSSVEAYKAIYDRDAKVTKDPWLYKCFSEDESSFGYTNAELAKARRHRIQPFFSKKNILAVQGVITEKVDLLHERLANLNQNGITPGQDQGVVVDLGSAIKSMTMDVITSFLFGESLNMLHHETFHHPVVQFMEESLPSLWAAKHFPVYQKMMFRVPPQIVVKMGAEGILLLKRNIIQHLDKFLATLPSLALDANADGLDAKTLAKEVIFHRLLDEEGRPIASRQSLYDEAQALFVAGSDTVGNTLSIGSFYILSTPIVYDRLRTELRGAWPSGALGNIYSRPGWEQLQKLPYLTAVIKESLRLSHGVISPLSRVVSARGLLVGPDFIPPGTIVASSAPFIHLNGTIFPDPKTFNPDRWLGPDIIELEKSLVAFSRGPRACIGMNLAWCELYLTFAMLFRKFDLELYKTTARDVEFEDYFVPYLYGRIRVKVNPTAD